MFKRFFLSLYLIPLLLVPGVTVPASADDLSQGLELYQAKKYKEAIPYLERAANDGHEKAIEALDQIYESQNKGLANRLKSADKAKSENETAKNAQLQAKDKADAKTDGDYNATTSDAEQKENSKGSFWRKVIAIFLALGIAIIWIIHRTILRRKRTQNQEQNPLK